MFFCSCSLTVSLPPCASDATRPTFARQVDSAIASVSELPSQDADEDDDSWLNIDEADFDSMMQKASGTAQKGDNGEMDVDSRAPAPPTEDELASQQASRLKDFADKVEKFVQSKGDLGGARFEE